MSIADNLARVKSALPDDVTLVAVSKTKPQSDILEAYNAGQRIFGENKVQEMVSKWEQLPQDIEWHMIGHLQRNKVKYMAPFVALVHGVDSERLLLEIDKQAQKHDRIISCLLQVHIGQEQTKFGLDANELMALAQKVKSGGFPNIKIKGLMGMATFTTNEAQVSTEFRSLKLHFENLKEILPDMDTLSMGMSGDYKLAIDEGSTMVRIGSSIFGARNYPV
ncbi:YggS family pyridoxal phosphate-dependent enzyme [Sediminicola luteus]|uniref:Pyridoxal phosphate homeostasis protein n=1 Tax=Sediminicola luteus TaxID=319238 RepID=A0A2A4G5I7_9FLAO|nr:YggS family pyridoxal phosphate-dependent enzyme [Sediminicola luteus]PCE63681.1 YggS family pyridoxal phosphate enzyme [Sediminicola luteus]